MDPIDIATGLLEAFNAGDLDRIVSSSPRIAYDMHRRRLLVVVDHFRGLEVADVRGA
jgi:hypothetical protein